MNDLFNFAIEIYPLIFVVIDIGISIFEEGTKKKTKKKKNPFSREGNTLEIRVKYTQEISVERRVTTEEAGVHARPWRMWRKREFLEWRGS